MFGEALEDLESCGQSELLRELEVLLPGQRACRTPCMDTLEAGEGYISIESGFCVTWGYITPIYLAVTKAALNRKGWGWRWLSG